MLNKEAIWRYLKSHVKQIAVTLLLFLPCVLHGLGFSFPARYIFLNEVLLANQYGLNFIMYPAFAAVYIFGAFGLIFILIYPFLLYMFVCAVIAIWEAIFGMMFGKRSVIIQIVVLIILFSIFVHKTVVIPDAGYNAVSIEIDTPSEINISENPEPEYDSGGGDISHITLQEVTIRNDSDYETKYKMPERLNVCLHDVESGTVEGYLSIYRSPQEIEWDGPQEQRIVLQPHSEVTLQVRVFRDIGRGLLAEEYQKYADDFDEFLMIRSFSYSSSQFCRALSAEQIASAERIKILR